MSYYYLIAGLPDLSLDASPRKLDCDDVFATIRRNLEPSDEKLFRYLVYPTDNRNLLNVLLSKYKSFSGSRYVSPAILTEEETVEYHKNKVVFPDYMSEYLEAFEDQFSTMSSREMEDRLWEKFYEEVSKQGSFIKDYFKFEKALTAITASYNADFYDFLSETTVEGSASLGQLGKGKSVPAALVREYPFIENLGEKIFNRKPEQLERFIDQIKWDFLEETKGFFEREQVFVYTIRLLMVKRWQMLESEKGESLFKDLYSNIKKDIDSFKTSIV